MNFDENELSEQELEEMQEYLESKLDCDFLPDTIPNEYDPEDLFDFVQSVHVFLNQVQAGNIDKEELKSLIEFCQALEPVYLH